MKSYLKNNNISVYRLAADAGIPYSTLNDIINGKVRIENCKVFVILAISRTLGLSMDEVFSLLAEKEPTVLNDYGIEVMIQVRHKSYFACFDYMDEHNEVELCRVNRDTEMYAKEIAKWRSEAYIRKQRMERF